MDEHQAAQNTDKELWSRETQAEPYKPWASVFLTKDEALGICFKGLCIVKPLEEWHLLSESTPTPQGKVMVEQTAIDLIGEAWDTIEKYAPLDTVARVRHFLNPPQAKVCDECKGGKTIYQMHDGEVQTEINCPSCGGSGRGKA